MNDCANAWTPQAVESLLWSCTFCGLLLVAFGCVVYWFVSEQRSFNRDMKKWDNWQ